MKRDFIGGEFNVALKHFRKVLLQHEATPSDVLFRVRNPKMSNFQWCKSKKKAASQLEWHQTVCISSGSIILVRWEEFLSIVNDVGGWSRNVRKISNKWFRRTNVPRFQLTWRHFSSYHTETLEVLQANSDFSTKTSIAFPRCCNTLSQHLTVLWKKASGCSIDRRRPPSRSLRLSELGKKDFKVNL